MSPKHTDTALPPIEMKPPVGLDPLYMGRVEDSYLVVIDDLCVMVARERDQKRMRGDLTFDDVIWAARHYHAAYVRASYANDDDEDACPTPERRIVEIIKNARITRVARHLDGDMSEWLDAKGLVILPANGEWRKPPLPEVPMVTFGETVMTLDEYLIGVDPAKLSVKRRKPAKQRAKTNKVKASKAVKRKYTRRAKTVTPAVDAAVSDFKAAVGPIDPPPSEPQTLKQLGE